VASNTKIQPKNSTSNNTNNNNSVQNNSNGANFVPSSASKPENSTTNLPLTGSKIQNQIPASVPESSSQANKTVAANDVQQVVAQSDATNNQPDNLPSSNSTNTSSTGDYQNIANGYKYVVSNYNDYYNDVKLSLTNFDDSLILKILNYDSNTYNLNVINKILDDYYDIDYGITGASGTIYKIGTNTYMEIQFQYSTPKSQMIQMRDAAASKANEIIASIITPGMSDLQKEKAIHDYIVNNTSYDYTNYVNGTLPEASFTDYGVLVNGKAVCEGYAKAMFRLLSLANVECEVVKGTADGQSHAWNIVKINGSYCQVDATWDDPVTSDGSKVLSYKYFDLSDSQMAKDHQWDTSKYPSCTTTQYNIN
jgi:transglutaminase/protease-like cytokinesis protein 3